MKHTPNRISFLQNLFLFSVLFLFEQCITTGYNETVAHYRVVEQKTPQFFADTLLTKNPQDYDIYIFSKGKIYKTTEFHSGGDSIVCKTIKLDSVSASKVRKRPLAERTKQVEICVTDSIPNLDTNGVQINIRQKDVIVVRRFLFIEAQPATTDNLGNTFDSKFTAVMYLILIACLIAFIILLKALISALS